MQLDEDLFLYSLSLYSPLLSLSLFILFPLGISADIFADINRFFHVYRRLFIFFFLDSTRSPPLPSLPFYVLDVLLRLQIHRFPFIRVNDEHNHPPLAFLGSPIARSDSRDESWEREQQGKIEREKEEEKRNREIRKLIDVTGVIAFDNASATRT